MAYSAPVLFCLPGALSPSFLFGCVCVIGGFGDFLPFVQFPLPSLWREKSGAQLSWCVSGVSNELFDVENIWQGKSLLLVWWWVLRPEFVVVCFVIFLGGPDVPWLCLVGIVLF